MMLLDPGSLSCRGTTPSELQTSVVGSKKKLAVVILPIYLIYFQYGPFCFNYDPSCFQCRRDCFFHNQV
jgi:hypothetical protein